ncbi:hypothetical protein K9K77_00150 [Candidatus Babeliales bacterium]|nr:hypothetical protein [Candidatus Babeliales bacterium]
MRFFLIVLLIILHTPFLFSTENFPLPIAFDSLNTTAPQNLANSLPIKYPQIDEMIKRDVRIPFSYDKNKKEHTFDSLSILFSIDNYCTIYKTQEKEEETFTLQLSQFTSQLQHESTEAYRNLDYYFDPMTGVKSKSWASTAHSECLRKKMLLQSCPAEKLKDLLHQEYIKILNYQIIFKEGIDALHKKTVNNSQYIVPTFYMKQLIAIENDKQECPNPFLVAYLYREIEKRKKGK